jgi:hypothetical protein
MDAQRAHELAAELIPKNPAAQTPFFIDMARLVVARVAEQLPDHATVEDLRGSLRDHRLIRESLAGSELENLLRGPVLDDILATIAFHTTQARRQPPPASD